MLYYQILSIVVYGIIYFILKSSIKNLINSHSLNDFYYIEIISESLKNFGLIYILFYIYSILSEKLIQTSDYIKFDVCIGIITFIIMLTLYISPLYKENTSIYKKYLKLDFSFRFGLLFFVILNLLYTISLILIYYGG